MKVKLFVMVGTAVVIVGTGKTHYGVVAGLVAYVLYGDGAKEYARLFEAVVGSKRRGGRGEGGAGATPTASATTNDTEGADEEGKKDSV